ncbi:hypothetical protein R1sor_024058 [Riccia sorocarpa]|uniref:Uncharacterized protein n=1 Tax=Riccia sorocarpa TaxID=122646 RepID=A0ABD3GRL3_9MARC
MWSWQLRGHLFNTLVIPVALYGVPIWGPALSRSSWKKLEAIQKSFLQKELGVRVQIPYSILLAESGRLPLEVEALILTLQFVFCLQKLETDRHSRLALMQSQSSGWFADLFLWASRWDFPEIKWSSESAIRSKLSILAVQKLWESPTPRQLYYTRDINRMIKYEEQPYLRGKLPQHIRQLISRYSTSSHSLYVQEGRWTGIRSDYGIQFQDLRDLFLLPEEHLGYFIKSIDQAGQAALVRLGILDAPERAH